MITLLYATDSSVKIQIKTTLQLKPKAYITFIVFRDQSRKEQTHVMEQPFPHEYQIHKLIPSSHYNIQARLENGQQNHIETLKFDTLSKFQDQKKSQSTQKLTKNEDKKILSISEDHLVQAIDCENEEAKYFENKKEIKQTVLKARKNQSSKGFISQEHKIIRPPEQRIERIRRIWMVSKGYEIYDNVFSNVEGFQYMKNNWNMGPFYSYDANAEELNKLKQLQTESQFI